MRSFTILTVVLSLSILGCGDDAPPPGTDAGPVDAGNPDTSTSPDAAIDGAVATGWETLGDQISPSTAESEDPAMMIGPAGPQVGYRHGSFQAHLQTWNGTAWQGPEPDPTGGNTLSSLYRSPDFCSNGAQVFLAYGHAGDGSAGDDAFYDRVFVYAWSTTGGWMPLRGGAEVSQLPDSSSGVGYNAFEPAIDCRSGVLPVVGWVETDITAEEDDDVFVDAVMTSAPSPRINRVATRITSSRTVDVAAAQDGSVYVAHFEHTEDASFNTSLFVTHYSGGALTNLGDALDTDRDSNRLSAPSIAVDDGGTVYVGWSADRDDTGSRHVYVARWSGSEWVELGGGPVSALGDDHVDSANPDVVVSGLGGITVAWDEQDDAGRYIFVAQLIGAAWDIVGDRINVDPTRDALDPSLTHSAEGRVGPAPITGSFYVAFEEMVDGFPQIFARRLIGSLPTR